MAWNTKGWDTRLQEVAATLKSLVTGDTPFDAPAKIQAKIDQMTADNRKILSNSLHLNKQKDKEWRKWVRAYALIEQVMLAPRNRSVKMIVDYFIPKQSAEVRTATRELIRSLDIWADWGSPDFAVLRPLRIGCGVSGGGASGPGSVACFVADNATGRVMLLTNQHVALQEFGGHPPPNTPAPYILQPARMNGGANANMVAVYTRGFLHGFLDAAVCSLGPLIGWRNETRPGGTQPAITITRAKRTLPKVGDLVWKCGAMSYISRGRVVDINKTSIVRHTHFGGDITFIGQIEVRSLIQGREFQLPGDSGSGLFNDQNEIIGVMHGGGNGGGLATPIGVVFDRLNVHFA